MIGCSLFVVIFGLVGLMAYLSQSRRSRFVWLVVIASAGISGCIAFWMVPPEGAPAYIWPLGGAACLMLAAGLTFAVIHFLSNERGRARAPLLPGADALRLWREKGRPVKTDVQTERKSPSDITS